MMSELEQWLGGFDCDIQTASCPFLNDNIAEQEEPNMWINLQGQLHQDRVAHGKDDVPPEFESAGCFERLLNVDLRGDSEALLCDGIDRRIHGGCEIIVF